MPIADDMQAALRALANERRVRILDWLKDPVAHFPRQVDGDLAADGVCGLLIARKLRVSQPTASDPAGAARHVLSTLKPDGTWMIVEPLANDKPEENHNPVGRVYYSASTMICTPASLAQEVGAALGAQAGEAKIREMVTAGGFTRFRRAAETPFNLVFEARP